MEIGEHDCKGICEKSTVGFFVVVVFACKVPLLFETVSGKVTAGDLRRQ